MLLRAALMLEVLLLLPLLLMRAQALNRLTALLRAGYRYAMVILLNGFVVVMMLAALTIFTRKEPARLTGEREAIIVVEK